MPCHHGRCPVSPARSFNRQFGSVSSTLSLAPAGSLWAAFLPSPPQNRCTAYSPVPSPVAAQSSYVTAKSSYGAPKTCAKGGRRTNDDKQLPAPSPANPFRSAPDSFIPFKRRRATPEAKKTPPLYAVHHESD